VIAVIVVTVVATLVTNEFTDLCPWLAGKLVRWSASYRYATDPGRAEVRAEELAGLIDSRPGHLFKLLTALGFVAAAAISRVFSPARELSVTELGSHLTIYAEMPCREDPELFFAESPEHVEPAKSLCRGFKARAICLAGAIARAEPSGVWGGELFLRGQPVPRRRHGDESLLP